MSDTYRLDKGAFNRGVDEVLKLKPITRIVKEMTTNKRQSTQTKAGTEVERRPGRKAS